MTKSDEKILELAADPGRWIHYLKARCKECPECGERWSWAQKWTPIRPVIARIQKTTLNVRRFLYRVKTGRMADRNRTVTTSCANIACINPDKLIQLTKRQIVERTAKSGKLHRPAMRAKMAASRRKGSRLSEEMVEQIRVDMRSSYVAAPEYGISPAHFRSIRNGKSRWDYEATPFAGLFTGLAANDSKRRAA